VSEKSISSLTRMLGVLTLFDDRNWALTAEEITDALGVSRPTGYRYVKILFDAGFLQRLENSTYALGPRIIVLDHYIRVADPVLHVAVPLMRELVAKTGFDCVTSGWFGRQVVDTHREIGVVPADLYYGRGRPRPLFQGAAPKVILAQLAGAQLRKVFNDYHDEAVVQGLASEWTEFRKYFAAIRKAGYYFSVGELQPQYAAVGAPIIKPEGSVWGAISLVFDKSRLSIVDTSKLTDMTIEAATAISARMTQEAPSHPR
jgi:DNA-binding IclR family transcriptional regulator